MSPMKEARLYAGEALFNLVEAGKHLGIAGMSIVTPLAKGALNKAEKAIEKAVESGKPEVAKALSAASVSLGKVSDALNKTAREMTKPEPFVPKTTE